MTEIFERLAAPFPKERIHWRAQSLTRDGSKAMALPYIDVRDVRERLNEVVGHQNWSNSHYDCGNGKLGCRLSLRIGEEWITKTDGAGDTQVEAVKGAFSDSLKRAAVAWGIGEYLYDMPAPWVPCESYQKGDRFYWKKWTADPWNHVPKIPGGVNPGDESGADKLKTTKIDDLPRNEQEWKTWGVTFKQAIDACTTTGAIDALEKAAETRLTALKKSGPAYYAHITDHVQGRREILETPVGNTLLGAG